MTDLRRAAGGVLLMALVSATCPTGARAEVGVAGGGASWNKIYILRSLVDDPDPVGISWVRYHADSPSRVVLNDGGSDNGDGAPSILLTPAGIPLVAWSRSSAQGFDVVVSRFDGGAWGAPEIVAGSGLDELDPVLFADPSDGSVHVVYWIDDATPRVMHRQTPADLAAWNGPTQVSPPDEPACRPTGVVHAGVPRIVYETHDYGIGATPRQIVVATRAGTEFVSEMLAVTLHAEANWPQAHVAGGRVWIDWIDGTGTMAWSRLEAGSWSPVQTEGFSGAEDREFHVRGRIRRLALD